MPRLSRVGEGGRLSLSAASHAAQYTRLGPRRRIDVMETCGSLYKMAQFSTDWAQYQALDVPKFGSPQPCRR
jgi:hypothetical protein